MRRILVIPAISYVSVANNRDYHELFALGEYLASRGEHAYWYMIVPPWVKEGLRGHNRLHYVHMETTRNAGLNDYLGYSPFELARHFSRQGGRHVIDAVITNLKGFGLYAQRLLSDPKKEPVPVFVRDSGWIVESEDLSLDRMMNYIGCRTGLISKLHKDMVRKALRSQFSSVSLKTFMQQSFVWPLGHDVSLLNKLAVDVKKQEKITAFCGGHLAVENLKEIFAVYRNLYVSGINVVALSTVPASRMKQKLPASDESFVSRMEGGLSLDLFRKEVARAHMFVSFADNELILNEEVERLFLGQVGIFPQKEWIMKILGPYPYCYKDEDEAVGMALRVAKNYDDAVDAVSSCVGGLKAKFSMDTISDRVWKEIVMEIDVGYQYYSVDKNRSAFMNTVYKVAEGLGDEFDLRVFLDVLEEHSNWLKPWGHKGTLFELGQSRKGLPTIYDLRCMLDNLGWIDLCNGPEVVLKRMHEPRREIVF